VHFATLLTDEDGADSGKGKAAMKNWRSRKGPRGLEVAATMIEGKTAKEALVADGSPCYWSRAVREREMGASTFFLRVF